MTTPSSWKKIVTWVKMVVIGAIIAVAVGILLKLSGFEDYTPKGVPITSPSGAATALRQIQMATLAYELRELKFPLSLEDLVGIPVPTPEGRVTNLSISLLEQQLGAKVSTVNYFPGFGVLDNGQAPTTEIVLAYIPDSKDNTQYCQVVYRGRRTKGTKWIGAERMEVVRVNQKIEWLTAYKKAIESNLPPPSAPMPR